MLLRTVASMGLICVLLGYAPLCQAQVHQFKPIRPPMQPAPKPLTLTDPREALRRPTPVAVLTSPDPQRLLTRLQEIVRSENFTILNTNARSGEFEASRKGDATSEKILVWLERGIFSNRVERFPFTWYTFGPILFLGLRPASDWLALYQGKACRACWAS